MNSSWVKLDNLKEFKTTQLSLLILSSKPFKSPIIIILMTIY